MPKLSKLIRSLLWIVLETGPISAAFFESTSMHSSSCWNEQIYFFPKSSWPKTWHTKFYIFLIKLCGSSSPSSVFYCFLLELFGSSFGEWTWKLAGRDHTMILDNLYSTMKRREQICNLEYFCMPVFPLLFSLSFSNISLPNSIRIGFFLLDLCLPKLSRAANQI